MQFYALFIRGFTSPTPPAPVSAPVVVSEPTPVFAGGGAMTITSNAFSAIDLVGQYPTNYSYSVDGSIVF